MPTPDKEIVTLADYRQRHAQYKLDADLQEAQAVADHYLQGIDRIRALGLACEPSIKPTQLGLDVDRGAARAHMHALAARAQAAGSYLWIDMEQSPYVDVTLTLTKRLREEFPRISTWLQSKLR